MCTIEFIKVIISIITLIIAISALFLAYKIPRLNFRNQILVSLFQEYRKPEMGTAVVQIWTFFNAECNGDIGEVKGKYIEKYNNEKNKNIKNDTLHFYRRMVSQYYQQLANLRYNNAFSRLSEKQVQSIFTKEDLKIIKILYVIETESMTELFESQDKDRSLLKNMKKLYDDSQKWKDLY